MKTKRIKIGMRIFFIVLALWFLYDLIHYYWVGYSNTKTCNEAYEALFVTERNAVVSLYEAIGLAIETPDEEHYEDAYRVATQTEEICMQTYSRIDNMGYTYGSCLVYYGTFYRDIKAAVLARCDTDDLQIIYELLGRIVTIYDGHGDSVENYEKNLDIYEFYKSIRLMEDEMRLCDYLSVSYFRILENGVETHALAKMTGAWVLHNVEKNIFLLKDL